VSVAIQERAGIFAWGAAGALLVVSFSLSCLILPVRTGENAGGSLLGSLLVGSQRAIGEACFRNADLYFHRGLDEVQGPRPGVQPLFSRWSQDLSPREHLHREGRTVAEIMPWLKFSTLVDPGNVAVYRVAAYWMFHGPGRADLADELLRGAQRQAPRDYRLALDRSRYFLLNSHLPEAGRMLGAAFRTWPGVHGSVPEDEARLDLGEMLLYKGVLRGIEGDRQGAIEALQQLHGLFPQRSGIPEHIAEFERNPETRKAAALMLKGISRESSEGAANHCLDD